MNAFRLHAGHALICALAVVAALLGWRALAAFDAPMAVPPRFVAPPVNDRELLARTDPFFGAAMPSPSSLPVTTLPFSLHGVRTDAATGQGSAIIATGDGEQKVHLVGEELGDGVTLAAVASDHVVLDSRGGRETLWLDVAGGQPVMRHDPTAYGDLPQPPDDPLAIPRSDVPDPPPPSSVETGATHADNPGAAS